MSVPEPLSRSCELRRCQDCDGIAVDLLRDEHARCTCDCHSKGKR